VHERRLTLRSAVKENKNVKEKKSSISLLIILIVVIMLCGFWIYKASLARDELDSKRTELAEYNRQIKEAQEKSIAMENEIRYRNTDEYIKEAARGIGLIDPDETIITPKQ